MGIEKPRVENSRVSQALRSLGQVIAGSTMSELFTSLADRNGLETIRGGKGAVILFSNLRMSGETIPGVSVQTVAAGYGASLMVVDNHISAEGVSQDLLSHDRVIAGVKSGAFDREGNHLRDQEIEADDLSRLAYFAGIRRYRGPLNGRDYDIHTEVTAMTRRLLAQEVGKTRIFEVE